MSKRPTLNDLQNMKLAKGVKIIVDKSNVQKMHNTPRFGPSVSGKPHGDDFSGLPPDQRDNLKIQPKVKDGAKKSKYGNKKVEFEGDIYDSRKELARYKELIILERQGFITDLKKQITFRLEVNGELICKYIADFTYTDRHGCRVVEDIKSPITRKNRAYRIKNKLMKAIYGVIINEV